jgi:hypothetical protein
MTTQTATANSSKQDSAIEQKIQKIREAYTDAPQIAKTALENVVRGLTPQVRESRTRVESAGRTGIRLGSVSELTMIVPFSPGGARRLRALLQSLDGNFEGAEKVGTVHDMRFVFLDNDTKLLFATAYDGDWDAYIDDFSTRIPDYMDIVFTACEGWPGIRSPAVKDWIAKNQITADGWYVANPTLTVAESRRLKNVGKAVDEFLDQISA